MGYFEDVLEEERAKVVPEKILKDLCNKLKEEGIPAFINGDKIVVKLSEGSASITCYENLFGWGFHLSTKSDKWGFGDFDMTGYADDGDVQHVVQAVKDALRRLAKHIVEIETS